MIVAGKQKREKNGPPPIREEVEQQQLFIWSVYASGKYPELDLLYHIPNGGKRNKTEAKRLKGEGVKAGVPDLCLPVARGGFHGLYIEMKRQGGTASKDQEKWIRSLGKQGYLTAVCYGWEAAAKTLENYLQGKISIEEEG